MGLLSTTLIDGDAFAIIGALERVASIRGRTGASLPLVILVIVLLVFFTRLVFLLIVLRRLTQMRHRSPVDHHCGSALCAGEAAG